MSLYIKKSSSFQILISLTTVVRPGYCHLKSEVTALNWYWCCHVVFWSDAPPSTDLPIMESVVLRHSGGQIFSSYHNDIGCRRRGSLGESRHISRFKGLGNKLKLLQHF